MVVAVTPEAGRGAGELSTLAGSCACCCAEVPRWQVPSRGGAMISLEGWVDQMEPPAQQGEVGSPSVPFQNAPLEDPGGQHPIRLMPPGQSDFYFPLLAPVTKTLLRPGRGRSRRLGQARPPCSTGHLSEERPSWAASSCPTPSFFLPATTHRQGLS